MPSIDEQMVVQPVLALSLSFPLCLFHTHTYTAVGQTAGPGGEPHVTPRHCAPGLSL